MACARKRGNWASDDLQRATKEVQEGKLSVRGASMKYGIPRSTIHDHASLKVKEVSHPGITCINKRGRKGVSTVGNKNGWDCLWSMQATGLCYGQATT